MLNRFRVPRLLLTLVILVASMAAFAGTVTAAPGDREIDRICQERRSPGAGDWKEDCTREYRVADFNAGDVLIVCEPTNLNLSDDLAIKATPTIGQTGQCTSQTITHVLTGDGSAEFCIAERGSHYWTWQFLASRASPYCIENVVI